MSDSPILCATDLSPGARRALKLGAAIARAAGRELLLLQAGSRDGPPKEAGARLEQERRHAEQLGVECRALHAEGPPWEVIDRTAQKHQAELIVVGPHGAGRAHSRDGAVRQWLVGSTVDRLLQHARHPVLVASTEPPYAAEQPGAQWLVGVDFGPPSIAAVRRAWRLASMTGGSLLLVHVIPPPGADELAADEEWDEEWEHARDERLAELAREHAPGAQSRLWEALARPSEGLCSAADHLGAGILVLGTHGRKGLRRLVVGSTAERCLRRAPVPVLVVRPPAAQGA